MRKLSLVRERRATEGEEASTPGDIRGLNDPQLFKGSGVEATLYLKGSVPFSVPVSVLTKYSLEAHEVPTQTALLKVQSVWRLPGEHKLQALRLFFSALEITKELPELACWLTFESGLNRELQKRIDHKSATYDQSQLTKWLERPTGFSMVHGLVLTLRQSGFKISGDSELVTLTLSEAHAIRHQVTTTEVKSVDRLKERA